MTDTASDDDERGNRRNAIVTYKEVAAINTKLAVLSEKLDGLTLLTQAVATIDARVRALELANAASSAAIATHQATNKAYVGTWRWFFDAAVAALLAVIAVLTYLHR